MEELRFDLERDAVRVVLTDEGGRVLLFHAVTPEVPTGWWELPGGGIREGESYTGAAVREGVMWLRPQPPPGDCGPAKFTTERGGRKGGSGVQAFRR